MEKPDYLKQATESVHWENRESPVHEYFALIKKFDDNPEGKNLLDVGCAEGIEVNEFSKLGLNATGVDNNSKFVQDAQKKYPDSKFVQGDAEALPFREDKFDYVFSVNTLFYTDLEKSIKEFCRVLKDRGQGIISFDIKIINLDENKIFYEGSLEKFEEILSKNNGEIIHSDPIEKRIDKEPFQHEHTFKKIVFQVKK